MYKRQGELLLHYDKSDEIETDRIRYRVGAAEVSEIDQNGNECSINLFTLERTIDYVNENLTVVSIGGELVPALRLILALIHISAGTAQSAPRRWGRSRRG